MVLVQIEEVLTIEEVGSGVIALIRIRSSEAGETISPAASWLLTNNMTPSPESSMSLK